MHEEDEQPLEGSEDYEKCRKQRPDSLSLYFLGGKQANSPTKTKQERQGDGYQELLLNGHVPVFGERLLEFAYAVFLEELNHD